MEWLQAPAHNRRREVVQLFRVLEEYLHRLQITPEKKLVFKKVFPQQSFDPQKLRQTTHYLLQTIENWLIYQQGSSDHQTISLLKAYRERHLGRLFEQQYQKVLRHWEQSPYQNPEHYFLRWQIARERYAWDSAQGRLLSLNLTEQEYYLQISMLGFKLRQACLSMAQQQVSNQQEHLPMLSAIIESAQSTEYQKIPMVQLYELALKLYLEPKDEKHFASFTENFGQYAKVFPNPEARDLLLIGINYGIKQINTGQALFLRTCFELFQQGLANDLLLEKGKINPLTYNNIAGIAIRLEELEWADHFLNHYQSQLDNRFREAVYALNQARIAYTRKDYTKALRLLTTINDRDFIHHMSARILQLKIYIDTEEIAFAINHIRNTRTYLIRKKNKGYHEHNYRNILQLAESWCRLPSLGKEQYQIWRKQVVESSPLTEKEWFLELKK
jgi:hypothetical protein